MMNYKPSGRAAIAIGIIKAIVWLIVTPIKWIVKKIRK